MNKETQHIYKIESRHGLLLFGITVALLIPVLVFFIWAPLGSILFMLYAFFLYWVFKKYNQAIILYPNYIELKSRRFGKGIVEQFPLDKMVEVESIYIVGRHRMLMLKLDTGSAIEKVDLGYPTENAVSQLYEFLKHLADLGISIKLTTTESNGAVLSQLKRIKMRGKVVNIKHILTTYALVKTEVDQLNS